MESDSNNKPHDHYTLKVHTEQLCLFALEGFLHSLLVVVVVRAEVVVELDLLRMDEWIDG
jgi:hypothetical protein